MKALHIAFLHSTATMSGVEFSTLYLAQSLDCARWSPRVILPVDGTFSEQCRLHSLPVQYLPLPVLRSTSARLSLGKDRRLPNPLAWITNPWLIWKGSQTLTAALHNHPVNLLVTKGMGSHLMGGLAAHRLGIPCLWHLQDFISERYLGLYARLFGLAADRLPALIVADGSPILEQLPAPARLRSQVILNGVNTHQFQPGLDGSVARAEFFIPPGAIVIGHVARMTPWKGQQALLDAFLQIASRFPEVHLMLVGSALFEQDDYERSLHRQAEASACRPRIHFTGQRSDLPQVLAAMDIFAYPALEKDTSPLALLSAMACGLPVVAFDIPGVREVVEQSGLLVPVRDGVQLAQSLARLLEDAGLRRQLGRASRQRAVEHFSLEAHADAMQEAFETALQVSRSSAAYSHQDKGVAA